MENRDFRDFNENDISEKNKEALQSEVWQTVRKAAKTEIRHFVNEFLVKDDPYGYPWEQVVDEYLKNGYKKECKENEITVLGETYKVLRREEVTVFYDAAGNTLFDVVNERLEKEYEWMLETPEEPEKETECQIKKQIEETGEADLKCSGDIDEKCADCNKAAVSEDTGSIKKETKLEKEDSSADKTETVKSYSSGEEKLIAEEDEMIASVKPEFKKIMQAQMDLIFKELIRWTKQDPEFEKKVLLNHKSMKRCMKFCADKAMGLREPSDQEKAAARTNNIPIMTPVGSDMLFEWIKEYYDKDDKAEVEKEKKADTHKKKLEPKKTNTKKEQDKKNTEKKDDAKTTHPPKKQGKLMDGQMSMFDLLGV